MTAGQPRGGRARRDAGPEQALLDQLLRAGVVSPLEIVRARERAESSRVADGAAALAAAESGADAAFASPPSASAASAASAASVASAADDHDAEAAAPPPAGRLLDTLTLVGAAEARAILRVACTEQRIVEHYFAHGFPVVPRLLRRLPRERALALGALPTISLDPSAGPAIVVAARPLGDDDRADLAAALGQPVIPLHASEGVLGQAIREAYDQLERRGRRDLRLGEMLVRDGLVDEATVARALEIGHAEHLRLGEALVREGELTEPDVYRYLAARARLDLIGAAEALDLVDRDVARLLPTKFCRHNRVLPYRRDGEAVRVLSSEPGADREQVRQALRARQVTLDLVTPTDFDRVLRHLGSKEEAGPLGVQRVDADEAVLLDTAEPAAAAGSAAHANLVREDDEGSSARYTQLADRILAAAIRARASDLHLEIYGRAPVVRFRVDGSLEDVAAFALSDRELRGLVNVFKIRSNLDIAERRLPQGGRMRKRTIAGDLYDFRVQTQPALHGEHVVIRLLAQSTPIRPLGDLGFSREQATLVQRLIRNPNGLCLIAGPTGSGKTTTLYSLLDELRAETDLKVMTIEDPIEYGLERVQQSQVRPEIGYGFAEAVRSFLREDPDVILVGETRDPETALETIRASQTGHLVLSTVHANDAVDAIRRMLDLGVGPPSLASELLAVIAQRLARQTCNACRGRYEPSPSAVAELFPRGLPAGAELSRGQGCEACRGSGFHGRIALLEVWLLGDAMKERIHRGASGLGLRRAARRQGWASMVDDAATKVLAGVTTVEEALSVLPYAKLHAEQESERAAKADAADQEP